MTGLESDPDNASEIEIRFVAQAADRTRAELEHRNIDRHGPDSAALSDGVGGSQGWPLYLQRYGALFG